MLFAMMLCPSYALRLGRVSGRGLVNASPRGAAAGRLESFARRPGLVKTPGVGFSSWVVWGGAAGGPVCVEARGVFFAGGVVWGGATWGRMPKRRTQAARRQTAEGRRRTAEG